MRPNKNYQWLPLVIGAVAFLTYSCGHESDWGESGLKASSTKGEATTITNSVSHPSEMRIGDIYAITFSEDEGLIDFSGVEQGAQFALVVSSLTLDGTSSIQLSNDEDLPLETSNFKSQISNDWNGWSAGEALDQSLRNAEMALSADDEPIRPSSSLGLKAMLGSSVPEVGTKEDFHVLASISALSSYKDVTAEAVCIEDNVIFYLDTEADSGVLTEDEIDLLCTEFNRVAGLETVIFGEPSDVNLDGRVAVLMTPQVNRLGSMGGGIITGFFFASDLYSGSNSNQREILYTLVPDPSGKWGTSIPKDFALNNLLMAVLPHELQHAINYNQKVLVNGGVSEETWLNEGLSHLAEDLVGYGQENPSRVEMFLSRPSSYGAVTAGSPGLAERGAVYLLLRYLYEQAADGNRFVWDMVHLPETGVAALEEAFGGTSNDFDQLSEFVLRWSATLALDSLSISTDPRYSYQERLWSGDTSRWTGICLVCETEDGRGTVLNGVQFETFYSVQTVSLESTASKFWQISSAPSRVVLKGSQDGTYGAVLVRTD